MKKIIFSGLLILYISKGYGQLSAEELKKLSRTEAIANGQKMPDIRLPNSNGDTIPVSELKGKYIFINFWATWCAPCINHMPFYDSLAKSLQGQNILFVYISIDRDVNKAIKYAKDNHFPGVQLFAGGDRGQPVSYFIYRVLWKEDGEREIDNGIPRYILLDKNGFILKNDLEKLTNDEIKTLLHASISK